MIRILAVRNDRLKLLAKSSAREQYCAIQLNGKSGQSNRSGALKVTALSQNSYLASRPRSAREVPRFGGLFGYEDRQNLGPAPLKMPETLRASRCVKKPAYSADEPFRFNSSST